MGQTKWPGLQERLRQCIAEQGYKNPAQFADAKHYRITMLYKWLDDTTPNLDNLERLARDLGVSAAWLLFGNASGVNKAPARPRKRGRQGLACLVAALGLTTGWGVKPADPRPSGDLTVGVNDAPSYRKRPDKLRRGVTWMVSVVWSVCSQECVMTGSPCVA
jgi:hypothetical protein